MIRLFIILISLVTFGSLSLAQDGLILRDGFDNIAVFPFEIMVDESGARDFDSVAQDSESWTRASASNLSLGYTKSVYWLRFRISRHEPTVKQVFLEISYPLHDYLEVHIPNSQGVYERTMTGDNFRFDERPISNTRFVFNLNLDEVAEQTVYVKIRSGSSMRIGMKLFSLAGLMEHNRMETAIFFLFYGAMSAMILYNILLYISIRDRNYVYYVFYILSHTMFQMSLNGHLFQYIFPDYPAVAAAMIPTLVGATSMGVSLFTQSFLETKTFLPRLHYALGLCFVAGVLLILINLILPYSVVIPLANTLPIYFSIVCFASGIMRLRQGYRPARIYVGAFAAFFSGVVMAASLTLGLIPSNLLTEYGAQIGSTIEVIMLSLALASKINIERKMRYETQKKALALALEKQHSYEQMSKMLYPHQLTMIQEGKAIDQTMPTGTDTACVLSFDVMDSSKVQNEGFNDLIEEFIADCRELMMRGYDDTTFQSTAYMIKEMGDGFLCSVGFPFRQLGGSKSECAVELARRIIERFARLNQVLDAPTPIYCCIGVAMGQVKSYFTRSGSVKYDLWGSGIILATRYEALRKEVMRKLKLAPANMLILQEDVYNSLPPRLRQEFQVHALADFGMQVRDHPEATRLVFMQIPLESSSTERAG